MPALNIQIKALWAMVALLTLAVLGLGWVVLLRPSMTAPLHVSLAANMGAGVNIGGAAINMPGVITKTQDNVLILDTSKGKTLLDPALAAKLPAAPEVHTDVSTVIAAQGADKGAAAYAADTSARNAKIQELLKDPVKNQTKLERVLNAVGFVLNPLPFKELHAGDFVVADVVKNADGTYAALRIIRPVAQ